MKKSIFTIAIINLNLVFLILINLSFNPSNLELSKLAWFSGFDWSNLLPSSIIGNYFLFGSFFNLFFVNYMAFKFYKKK
jgi:hypothetical protein